MKLSRYVPWVCPRMNCFFKPLCLITAKPAMFVGNVSDHGFTNNPLLDKLTQYATAQGAPVVAICAAIEAEISELSTKTKPYFWPIWA